MSQKERHPEYQYLDLLREILEEGTRQEDKGTGAVTWSIFGRQNRYDLKGGFPLLTTKKVFWKGVLEEFYWFLSGQTNIRYLVGRGVHIWDDYPYRVYREAMEKGEAEELTKEEFIDKIEKEGDFAARWGELRHVYGDLWRHWPASDGRRVDQLQWVVDELKRDPDCHNAIVIAWYPEKLYDMARPGEALRFPLCHILFQFNVKNGRLCLQLYQRTADIFLGVPFNIASYALLLLVVAKVTGYEPGEFVHTFGDVHLYGDHFEQAKEQLEREPRPFPSVTLGDFSTLDEFRPEHVTLEGYDPHPPIKAPLSPTGGVVTEAWKKYVKEDSKDRGKEKK